MYRRGVSVSNILVVVLGAVILYMAFMSSSTDKLDLQMLQIESQRDSLNVELSIARDSVNKLVEYTNQLDQAIVDSYKATNDIKQSILDKERNAEQILPIISEMDSDDIAWLLSQYKFEPIKPNEFESRD